jgi:hypothetical protein
MNVFSFGFSKIKCEGSLLNWLFLNEKSMKIIYKGYLV